MNEDIKGLVLVSGEGCPSCTKLKKVLESKEVSYTEVDIMDTGVLPLLASLGVRSIPQLLQNNKLVSKESYE